MKSGKDWNIKADNTWLSPKNDISHLVTNMNNTHQELIEEMKRDTPVKEEGHILAAFLNKDTYNAVRNTTLDEILPVINTILKNDKERLRKIVQDRITAQETIYDQDADVTYELENILQALDKTPLPDKE